MAAEDWVPTLNVLIRCIALRAAMTRAAIPTLDSKQQDALVLFARIARESEPAADASVALMRTARGALREVFYPGRDDAFSGMLAAFIGQLACMAHVLFVARRYASTDDATEPQYRMAIATLAHQLQEFACTISWGGFETLCDDAPALMTLNLSALLRAEKMWKAHPVSDISDAYTLAVFIAQFIFDFAVVVRRVADIIVLGVGMERSVEVTARECACLNALSLISRNDFDPAGTATSLLFAVTDEIIKYVRKRVLFTSGLRDDHKEEADFMRDFAVGTSALMTVYPSSSFRVQVRDGHFSLSLLMVDDKDGTFVAVPEHVAYLIILALYRDGSNRLVIDTIPLQCDIGKAVGDPLVPNVDLDKLTDVFLQIMDSETECDPHLKPWARGFHKAAVDRTDNMCTPLYQNIIEFAEAFDRAGVWVCSNCCDNRSLKTRLRCFFCGVDSYCSIGCMQQHLPEHQDECVPQLGVREALAPDALRPLAPRSAPGVSLLIAFATAPGAV